MDTENSRVDLGDCGIVSARTSASGPNVVGLTDAEVAERVAAGRTNQYSPDSSRSAWHIVRANVFTRFNGIVFACFFTLFLVGRWQDALFGFAAIANSIVGCVQEYRAKAALDKLALLNAAPARVVRDGAEREIRPGEVVVDDVLMLRAGDQVPADAVVLETRTLQVDESMLTGESDAVDKRRDDEVLSGSIVVAGEGSARVTEVGADSYANRFAGEAKKFSLVASELRSSVNRVLKWVGWIIGPVGLLVFNAQIMVTGGYESAFESGGWVQAVVNTIAALTAMIPLGLVLMTSIAFAVSAVKLASKQVLVNELPAVEVLARVDVVCLDKTGTLTVGDIAFDRALPMTGANAEAVAEASRVLGWYAFAPDAIATARALRAHYPDTQLTADRGIPFSSARKWSAVSFRDMPGTWVMGAPEMIFGDAATSAGTELGSAATRLTEAGRRTLVLARSDVSLSEGDASAERLPQDLVAVVILTLRETVRPDAAQTLEYFERQGVGIRIISGDHPRTVAAIARDVGLDVASGFDARTLPDDDAALADVLERETVFGRVTPEQKKRMVAALQSRGHVVAMTGDGVNDALAIKSADIGIAMNSGSAATKAVARLVLLDGQFSHLPDVVAEGRQAIANIERVSMLFLNKTVYATALAIIFGVLVLEFPFLPRQLSITDGLTIGIPAFFLALMPNVQRYMPGFLRRSLIFAVPAGLVVALGLTWYTFVAMGLGVTTAQMRTGATIILAIVGIWVLTVLSRPLNRYKALVIGAMFIALIGVFTLPLTTTFFELVDPGQDLSTAMAGIVIVMIAAIEAVRFVHRRLTSPVAAAAALTVVRPRGAVVVTTIVAVIAYGGAVLAVLLGTVVLLSRYGADDVPEVRVISLTGAGLVLLGLLALSAAAGLRRGSGLSRLLVTIWFALLFALNAVVLIGSDDWDGVAAAVAVVAAAVIVLLWTPPASRMFGRIRDSAMTQTGRGVDRV